MWIKMSLEATELCPMDAIHELRNTPSTPTWLALLLIGSHYTCCHNTIGNVKDVFKHSVPVTGCSYQSCRNDERAQPAAAQADDHDPFSVAYSYLVKELYPPPPPPPPPRDKGREPPGEDDTPFPTDDRASPTHPHYSHHMMIYGNAMLASPTLLLMSTTLPLLYTNHSHSADGVKLLTLALGWTLGFAAVGRWICTRMMLPHLTLCIAMHAAAHQSFAMARALSKAAKQHSSGMMVTEMTSACMNIAIGLQCFCIIMCSDTAMSLFDPPSFFFNHMAALTTVDLVRSIWWTTCTWPLIRSNP